MTTSPTSTSLPSLVLIPGLMCTAKLYQPQIDFFQASHNVLMGDVFHDDSIEQMAARVLATAPPTFALAGLSMGGIVAFEILRQAPQRVERVALLDTEPGPEQDTHRVTRQKNMAYVKAGGADVLEQLIMEKFFPYYVAPARRDEEYLQDCMKSMVRECGVEVFMAQSNALMHRADSWSVLDQIEMPTLVMCGDQDKVCRPSVHEAMAERVKHVQLEIIPECGHLSTLEQPLEVNRLLKGWLTPA